MRAREKIVVVAFYTLYFFFCLICFVKDLYK